MTTRTCACSAAIVAADLDGYTVWLDIEPVDGGMFSIADFGDDLVAQLDLHGVFQRHECAEVSGRSLAGVTDETPVDGGNVDRQRVAAGRTLAAIAVLAEHRVELDPADAAVARARIANPGQSLRKVAGAAGLTPIAYRRAVERIERQAYEISTGAAA